MSENFEGSFGEVVGFIRDHSFANHVRLDAFSDKGHKPVLLHPDSFRVTDMERFLPNPQRTDVHVSFEEPLSFIRYLHKFSNVQTVILASRELEKIVAIIDYDDIDNPSWRTHTATLKLSTDKDFSEWLANSQKPFAQEDFAWFLDDHMDQITSDRDVVLNAVKSFKMAGRAELQSKVDDHGNLVEFEFRKGAEKIGVDFPKHLNICLIPYRYATNLNSDSNKPISSFNSKVRLKYSMQEKKDDKFELSFSFVFRDADRMKDEAFTQIVEELGNRTNTPFFIGSYK